MMGKSKFHGSKRPTRNDIKQSPENMQPVGDKRPHIWDQAERGCSIVDGMLESPARHWQTTYGRETIRMI
jgi:hypothetical protein